MQWEYIIVHVFVSTNRDHEADRLCRLGAEGWEAVSAWAEGSSGSYVLLKRKK